MGALKGRGRRPARLFAVAAAVAATLAVTGCSTTGEVWLTGDELRVDLQLRHPIASENSAGPCDSADPQNPLTVSERVQDGIDVTCRLSGTVAVGERRGWGYSLDWLMSSSDDHLYVVVPPPMFGSEGGNHTFDVTMHLPGPILATSGGEVSGNRVRWTDLRELNRTGLAVTAATGPVLPAWVGPALLGLGVGGALVVGVRVLALGTVGRRDAPPHGGAFGRRRLRFGEPWVVSDDGRTVVLAPSAPPPAPPEPPPPQDPAVWAPDERRG